ncbi:HAMP domain-containing sensor histidine kinase [Winogradskyella sp. SYSU M77433]|uniref:sensor histidine kinase n=1 Tax=Winogradskyella sp. SYSU M77433 TaxID=3042722 RepID=UPI0024806B82|nr:HAMP domain-containing sensor histidine kinase [Winogradskyella sp. SYSU M77433]MDH7911229.1 HAMP domain-containing sensor histidine kinase [Winogradskyella sp. SYSU M77433]
MQNLVRKNLSVSLFFSYKLTAIVTILVSVINITFWLTSDFHNVFSGYTINPSATMKVITSISFLLLGFVYFLKNKTLIQVLILSGLLIQTTQLCLISFGIVDPIAWRLSSIITIILFVLTYLALYFIKVKRLKVVFLLLNGSLYILSSFAVFYYLLDMEELNTIPGFETLSWNTAMLFFMNSISLFELKLIKRISPIKLDQITSRRTHPYNYFPYFFLIPILLIILTSVLAYNKIITVVQAAFFIILFLNTSSFINMFFYSYNFIIFYIEITKKSSELRSKNRKLNTMNTELVELNQKLKKKNAYLEDFATITSHNLREPIIALEELQKVSEQITSDESFTNEEVQTMFNTSIQRLNQGINSLVQYHNFIKNEDLIDDQKISLKAGIEYIYSNLEKSIPKNTSLTISIKDDLILSKNCIDTVFRNLLSNSFKYKRENVDLKITISAYKVNNTYNILYKDNGSGINLIFFKKHLFRKRKRFHKRSHNSNGYGLYFTELCIKKLNGKMDIFSTPGKGTAFRIKIKLPHSYE